ncbi:hypothetical protein M501DRAFT_1013732 [Patellaria atrata CBS 101060]|uniref:Zn(2)-C6 fungal-type domain-containing protein n=1 Tax=Patellaria atrata CBS 101060 TaxID=1346257 RepID=A0A9P4SIV4_9PEZI|nr:hypothetical protein M501DRAFT_1013732 [Patellaria atrata CBS 101060]
MPVAHFCQPLPGQEKRTVHLPLRTPTRDNPQRDSTSPRSHVNHCDGARPVCSPCQKKSPQDCHYDAAGDQRRTSALKQRVLDLENENADLKRIINELAPDASPNKVTGAAHTPNLAFQGSSSSYTSIMAQETTLHPPMVPTDPYTYIAGETSLTRPDVGQSLNGTYRIEGSNAQWLKGWPTDHQTSTNQWNGKGYTQGYDFDRFLPEVEYRSGHSSN